jgi:hypothetical protein
MASNTTDLVIRGRIELDDSQAIKQVSTVVNQVEKGFMNVKGWKHAGEQLKILHNTVKETTEAYTQQGKVITTVVRDFDQLINAEGKLVTIEGKSASANYKLNEQIKTSTKVFHGKTEKVEKDTQATKKNVQQTQSLVGAQQKANASTKNLGLSMSNLGETFVKVAKFKIVTELLMSFINAGNEAIEIVKKFDSALTEFKKVSDLSGKELEDYTEQLGKLGTEVARTSSEMLEASTSFVKSGYSEEDSAQLAKVSEMFRNIADSEMSASDSAKVLISTLKGFNMEVDQAEHVADVINETSNNFAVSSTDISNGLANVSAVSHMAGNSIEQTTGMLTAMVEVTQSAGKSSRGLNFRLGTR